MKKKIVILGSTGSIGKTTIKLLEKDNIVSNKYLKLRDLNVTPVSLELVIGDYLKRFAKK